MEMEKFPYPIHYIQLIFETPFLNAEKVSYLNNIATSVIQYGFHA